MKKLLALVLALVLALGVCGMTATAESEETITLRLFPYDPQKPDDAPRLDREIHAVECRLCAVTLAQPSAFENCHVC